MRRRRGPGGGKGWGTHLGDPQKAETTVDVQRWGSSLVLRRWHGLTVRVLWWCFRVKRMRYDAPRLDMESVCLGRLCTGAAATRMARVSCFRFWGKSNRALLFICNFRSKTCFTRSLSLVSFEFGWKFDLIQVWKRFLVGEKFPMILSLVCCL
jgi:hypothetical protein